MEKHRDNKLIEALGGASALAKALKLKRARVSNWPVRGIPWQHKNAVERLAKKKEVPVPRAFWRPIVN